MTGKTIIVTGANSGLGYEVTRYLCEGGNDVILACRSEEKTNRAIEKIKRTNPNALATFMQLDLADLESIRKFVETFHESEKKLHILVNNAAVSFAPKDTKRQYTKENFELTIGTNHLGHFLLTNLLLEDLKKSGGDGGDARVLNITASTHDPASMKRRNRAVRDLQPLDLDNIFLFTDGTYNGFQAYKNSKLANVMFTYELAKKLEGSGVTANCVDPGFMPSTDLNRTSPGAQKFFHKYILHGMLRFTKMTKTPVQGAQAVCNLVTDEKYKETTGKYFQNGEEAKSSEESLEEEKQKALWEKSGGYVKLEGFEAIEVERPPEPEPETPKKKAAEKKEEGEASKDEEAKPAAEGDGDNKTDEEKKEETKPEETKTEETKEVIEEKKEEVKEEVKEEKPDESSEKPAETTEEKKEEEKKE